jgi:hypothetical protein
VIPRHDPVVSAELYVRETEIILVWCGDALETAAEFVADVTGQSALEGGKIGYRIHAVPLEPGVGLRNGISWVPGPALEQVDGIRGEI